MLAPDTRRVLMEALRPPEGFRVDRALATTYSLDLMALLTAPLAFSLFDGFAGQDATANPLALLKSVRAFAERTTVFCQSAQIAPPGSFQRLLAYLEGSVVEVNAPSPGGVFHPKLWALRMVDAEGQVAYRLLCLSRNLTFDSSWDTVLVLDGALVDRSRAFASNRPLSSFFAALPQFATRPPPERVLADVALVSDELLRVEFELPEPFESLEFHPVGIPGFTRSPIPTASRALIVSPFLTAGGLETIAESGILVSRMDALAELPPDALKPFEVHVLHDGAELLELGEEPAAIPDRANEYAPPPTGLHAKLFVQDDGWKAHLWTGSLNATTAALHQNVEFLVQLTGKKSQVGIEAVLEGRNGVPGLRALLASWSPEGEFVQGDPVALALEERIHAARRSLSRISWVANVGEDSGGFSLRLQAESAVELSPDLHVEAWPISLARETYGRPLARNEKGCLGADFGKRSFEALTSFFGISLSSTEGDQTLEKVFVINARLLNAPADRSARVLQSMLDDPAKVLRFLRMLLAVEPLEILRALEALGESDHDPLKGESTSRKAIPLLEALMRALDRDPSRLDAIELVVRDLLSTEEGRKLLPKDFLAAWEPIREARRQLEKEVAA